MNRPKILLFDIDGTLLLTGGVGRIAFERAFEELFGIREVWGSLIPDGKTDPLIIEELAMKTIKRVFREQEYRELCRRYTLYFQSMIEGAVNFRLMPGVVRLLAELTKYPHLYLGIQTGNFEDIAHLKLRRGNIHRYFRFGGYGSDSRHRTGLIATAVERARHLMKKRVSPRCIFVIGDAAQDIRAGRQLGFRTVAVTTGRSTYSELMDCGPEFVVRDLSDIPRFSRLILSC